MRMDPDKARDRKPHRDEYQVAHSTKELGRPLQRKLLQPTMEASGSGSRAAHGEDCSSDSHSSPPRYDRAG